MVEAFLGKEASDLSLWLTTVMPGCLTTAAQAPRGWRSFADLSRGRWPVLFKIWRVSVTAAERGSSKDRSSFPPTAARRQRPSSGVQASWGRFIVGQRGDTIGEGLGRREA